MASVVVRAETAEAMQALGERLGRALRAGDVVALVGPLGAGKTTFVQGLARGAGVPADRLEIAIAFEPDGARRLTLAGGGPRGDALARALGG